jgi:transcription elongation GreA/GreB family factor
MCEPMDARLAKFSDRQISQMMGALNDGKVGMRNRLLCEASYRLARSGGAAMTAEEEDLLDEIMTYEFRLRENGRKRRRASSGRAEKQPSVVKGGSHNRGAAASKIRCIR